MTVISHEILAGATPDVVRRALDDLGDLEVHVVFTARDLSRALPGAWQESIKQGRTWTYERFLEKSRAGRTWFRRALDPVRALGAWAVAVPPERLHLVLTPADGARRGLLWERFCLAAGIPPESAPRLPASDNASLGAAEAQLLRLVNQRLVDGPAGRPLEFEAETIDFAPDRTIAWRTLRGQKIEHYGRVRFEEIAEGTRVSVDMTYRPPGGVFGHAIAHLLGWDPKSRMDEDLVRMKALLEAGHTRAHRQHVELADLH